MPEKKEEVKVEEVPTKFEQKFSLPDGSIVSLNEFLAWIGNQLIEIKKSVE